MSGREWKLRNRIDTLFTEVLALRQERDQLLEKLRRQQAQIRGLELPPLHRNQHGPVVLYETEEQRREGRRRSWRNSKRRRAHQLRAAG